MASPEAPQKPKHLELPTPSGNRPRLTTTPSHLLPATALFHGPNSHNASRSSLNYLNPPPDTKSQHLPRASPPTASFSGPRSLATGEKGLPRVANSTANATRGAAAVKREDDFRADAVWAEMQKTLADVELSAMSSSHVFSSTHAKALEDLRIAQLGLAQAWAKSEADEMIDEEFSNVAPEQSAVGTMKQGMYGSSPTRPMGGRAGSKGHAHSGSEVSRNLEEETDRDIRLARKRREANDRYFRQVNRGVLDVVSKLDEVANAMRRVEKESREIWNDSSGSEDLDELTETDRSVGPVGESVVDTDTDVFIDSPVKAKT